VLVAKNYLSENAIRRLERAVAGYFDYIEDLTENENTFTMQQFAAIFYPQALCQVSNWQG
jgi:hypothetical protein